jgi:uncharacterized repeat protein (TIGR03843 family)
MDVEDMFAILETLRSGEMEIEGVLPWSSNYAFLARVCDQQRELTAVYKPQRGERPLWDFPRGSLNKRELAAFLVSDALNWDLVPPTVLRRGPHGPGSVQLFIDHDPETHYFTLEGRPEFCFSLQRMALFDVIINNADRKGGHVLLEADAGEPTVPGRLWGIDHGICFHGDYKLRTVIWEFAGQATPPELLADMESLRTILANEQHHLSQELGRLLSERELSALRQRLNGLLQKMTFPRPGPGRHYPWPPV